MVKYVSSGNQLEVMSMEESPAEILKKSIESVVIVRLKNGREFRGTLKGFDSHMNIILEDAEEIENGVAVRRLGTMIIRGDNVVFVSP